MASRKKQTGMVLVKGGVSTPAVDHLPAADRPPAAEHRPACVASPRPGRTGEGGMAESRAAEVGKPTMNLVSLSSDGLSPDSVCRGVRVTLENSSMWNEFFRCRTEMILTKQGSRMFPYCRFRIYGLRPSRKYSLIMDIQPLDNSRYEWTGSSWQVSGEAEPHVKSTPFCHPESPSTGQNWMQTPVSFYRLKLTNNIADREGNAILHPMQRYLPRLHLVQTDKPVKDIKLSGSAVYTFTFPQTEFMAVTGYQNHRFAQLKVDYNPFAKGLKEDSSANKGLKLNSRKDVHKDESTTTNMKKSLKSLLANHRPRSSKAADSKPSTSCGLQKHSTTEGDQPAAKTNEESSRSPPSPPQKLFSELIREAHVSLQRCNLKQLSTNVCHGTEQTTTKTMTQKHNGPGDGRSVTVPAPSGPERKENQDLQTSVDCRATMRPDSAASSSVDSDLGKKPEGPSEDKVKPHKRPVPLPLPALALFLKQHSTKARRTKSRTDPPPQGPEPQTLSKPKTDQMDHLPDKLFPTQTLTDAPVPTDPDKPRTVDPSVSDPNKPRPLDPSVSDPNKPRPLGPSVSDSNNLRTLDPWISEPNRPRTPDSLCSDSGRRGPELADFPPVSCSSDQNRSSSEPSSLTSSSVFAPGTAPSDHSTMRSDSLLPDPECSSFNFEPLSPASSAESLPLLPVSLTLDLDPTPPEPQIDPPEVFRDGSAASVFKWHTVLPPPENYDDSSTFQATPPTLPLTSVTSPVLPSETPPLLNPHDPPATPHEASPSFQVNDQVLPFPAELSPLQLSLSPTFSSLDGDGLSPTPSLADLVHFFSINDDLGIGVEFSNSETAAATCPSQSTGEEDTQEVSQPPQAVPANKPPRCRKENRRRKVPNIAIETDNSTYTLMKPNLEEVEEQLFISFTSKEALKLHVPESLRPSVPHTQTTPDAHLQPTVDSPELEETVDSMEEKVASFQKILQRDLKLMRHQQVIHPVLQEVGLKMNLLDPAQSIDLQYLGVHLPLPPPGGSVDLLSPAPNQGVCGSAFTSRTGKTSDVTQIKGWREKFSPTEAPPPPPTQEGAGPGSDPQKKNLSAFCSDMLDQYLESEAKLIDQRADSFSQPQLDPPAYQLPTSSTSYVRTLHSVIQNQTSGPPTSDLITGFVPPSKRPKVPPKESRTSRRETAKQRGLKPHKPRPELASVLASGSSPPGLIRVTEQQAGRSLHPHPPTVQRRRRRRLKHRTMSRTFGPPGSTVFPPAVSGDLAPLESDTELEDQNHGGPVMTRALLRQKDLEDGGVWEGQPRTRITEERAAIALTSLFTLKGFVVDNPTTPVQVTQKRAPPCLSESCRLGCVCSSLAHGSRISHCGRSACMLGCSCLKQKVVLLKNLEPDSSPSHQGHRKRRRKRRMKMAYVLKEVDRVSQPTERVQTLWRRSSWDSDPDPVHTPKPGLLSHPRERSEGDDSCARVRGYHRKGRSHKRKEKMPEDKNSEETRKKRRKLKNPQSSAPPTAGPDQSVPSVQSAGSEPTPKPSKRLIILAEGKWGGAADRGQVLTHLCERMARDQLDEPFWVLGYHIVPISQTSEGTGPDQCIQYRVHISRPEPGSVKPVKPPQETNADPQDPPTQVFKEAEPPEEWQQEVEEEEAESPEEWQREVEEGESEEEGSTCDQVHDGNSRGRSPKRPKKKKTTMTMVSLGLPFLTGVSPAGFLSTNRKQPGGTDHLVQVNGKLYPLAKIQLGQMGALHPANRLAAYLTGRVGSSKKQPGSSKPVQNQNLRQNPQTTSVGSAPPPPKPQQSVTVFTVQAPPTEIPPPIILHQSAAPIPQPDPEGAGQKMITVKLVPGQTGGTNQATAVPEAPGNSAPSTDPQQTGSLGQNQALGQNKALGQNQALGQNKALAVPQLMLVQTQGGPSPLPVGGRMVLKSVQTTSGAQFYRTPDGKLIQLVPINQLRPVPQKQNQSVGLTLQKVRPPGSGQNPLRTSAPPTLLPPLPTQVRPVAPPPGPAQLRPPRAVSSQRATCSFKIVPADSTKEPTIVACVKVPPPQQLTKVAPGPASFTLLQPPRPQVTPVNLLPLNPSVSGSAEPGVQTVKVAPGGVMIHQRPQTAIQTTTIPQAPPSPSLPGSEVTPPPVRVTPASIVGGAKQVAGGSTSSETQNSSDSDEEMERESGAIKFKENVETNGPTDPPSAAAEMEASTSSETENSSDFEKETDGEKKSVNYQRNFHNFLEKQRRGKMRKLFRNLERELGQQEKTPKIHILNKAVQVIGELRTSETDLRNLKKKLRKKRDNFLNIIAPASGSDLTNVMEAELLDELMYNLSDEEEVVAMTTSEPLTGDQGNLSSLRSSGPSKEKLNSHQSLSAAFRCLRSVLNNNDSPRAQLLKQAHREIQTLQCETRILKSLKICLRKQRDAYLRKIHQRPGNRSSFRRRPSLKKHLADSQLLASEKGSASPSADDVIVPPSNQQLQLPAPIPVQKPVALLAPPTFSQNTVVSRDRIRTVPNILSRSKKTVPGPLSFQAVVPAEVLSLVGASIPGQPVLTMSPLTARPTVTSASAGVASVTLNISGLTNQQIHLTPLPRPQTATNINKVLQLVQPATQQQQQITLQQKPVQQQETTQQLQQETTTEQWITTQRQPTTTQQQPTEQLTTQRQPTTTQQQPTTILMQLTATQRQATTTQQQQPTITQEQQTPTQQQQQQSTTTQQWQYTTQQLKLTSQQSAIIQQKETQQQQQLPTQKHNRQTTEQPPEEQELRPPESAGLRKDTVGGARDKGHGPGDLLDGGLDFIVGRNGSVGGASALTSLLHEIDFLNSKSLEAELKEEGGAVGRDLEQGGPWLLELDSDSEDAATMDTLKNHEPPSLLTPPPLQQMKVGGVKEAEPAITDEAGGGVEIGQGGVSWRPMPRLVPLGLKGHAPI
ncbi:MAX gene-associated protein-like isoform X4 [Xyrichtys novacula]|uniref:MAX gene-associated protein-like isoform X4 n=1 Tax=Xyrichtys novacula TaxID=13765 RepID=A0AAV1GLU6_XYRNO|nr:MAX gene-associated protein-like isoform X4 [Xyrichtys novacula]